MYDIIVQFKILVDTDGRRDAKDCQFFETFGLADIGETFFFGGTL